MILNIATFSDCDFIRTFVYKTIDGVSIDLAGSSFEMMVRARADDATVYIDLSTGNGLISIDFLTLGTFTVHIPQPDLEKLSAGEYVHSLIRKRPDKILEQVWRGTLTHAIGPTR
jgi:hypothetical protein